MIVIYRKRDKLIAGHVYPRKSEDATNAAIAEELTNVVNSELGGSHNDYGLLEVAEDDLTAMSEIDPVNPINYRLARLEAR